MDQRYGALAARLAQLGRKPGGVRGGGGTSGQPADSATTKRAEAAAAIERAPVNVAVAWRGAHAEVVAVHPKVGATISPGMPVAVVRELRTAPYQAWQASDEPGSTRSQIGTTDEDSARAARYGASGLSGYGYCYGSGDAVQLARRAAPSESEATEEDNVRAARYGASDGAAYGYRYGGDASLSQLGPRPDDDNTSHGADAASQVDATTTVYYTGSGSGVVTEVRQPFPLTSGQVRCFLLPSLFTIPQFPYPSHSRARQGGCARRFAGQCQRNHHTRRHREDQGTGCERALPNAAGGACRSHG
jgi:hypothetical protein